MKILVLTDRFVPEISAPSFRVMDHAQVWLKMGHEVTVVTCAPNFPHGKVFPGYRNRLYQEEWLEGVRVIRIWSYMAPNVGKLRRTFDYLSFMLSVPMFFWRYPSFDVIVATSPPLFVALAGYLLSVLRRRPWVFEIRDLWPASIQAVGATSRGWGLRLLEKLELFLYRKADRIVSLTESFKEDLVSRGIPADKNDVVTNGVDADVFSRDKVQFDARQRLAVAPDTFLVGYIGTIGMAHGLQTILDAAELCPHRSNVRFLIMGEGAERAKLEQEAMNRGLSNVLFRDFVPHEQIPTYLAALDASIVHLKPDPLFKTVIPSKIFESMAMGTPMVYAVEGESARIVEDAGAGVCIPPGDSKAMAETVLHLEEDRSLLEVMRQSGREAVCLHYSREVKAKMLLRSLNAAIDGIIGDSVADVLHVTGVSPSLAARDEFPEHADEAPVNEYAAAAESRSDS